MFIARWQRSVRLAPFVVAVSWLGACALPTGGLAPARDTGLPVDDAAVDGGVRDTGVRDTGVRDTDTSGRDSSLMDTGTVDTSVADTGSVDTGSVDTGSVDTGTDCSGFVPHCEGETRVVCDTGGERRQDCSALSAYCDESTGMPTCVDWVCTPDATTCSGPAEQTACDARGTAETITSCDRGCDTATGACRPETPCALSVEGTITTGRMSFDTCMGGDDSSQQPGCTGVDISGGDRILRLGVPVANTYRIDLNDARGGRDSDPMVYLRTACEDPGSEIACNDDRSGDTLNSRVELRLEPGEYFLIMDSFRDTDEMQPGRCGGMNLNVSIR